MAKIISTSLTDGGTYTTLPGSTGDFNYDGATASDTVFGQSFESTQPTIISTTLSANAYYKGYAGYVATFNKSGTTTAMTTEAMTLVSGKTYKITAATKNVWDHTATFTVFDNAVDHTADVISIDHLFGRVTFSGSYTVTGAVTVTGSYLPMTSVGTAREFSLTMNTEAVDTTDFATASANGGFSTFVAGLRTVSLDASGFFATANGFKTLLTGRSELVVEINPDGADLSAARGFFRATSTGQSGDVGGNEDESITFELSVPSDSDVVTPFKWLHDSSTTLNTALQNVLTAWDGQDLLYAKYLHDGTNGWKVNGVVTDCSLSGSVDGINEFSVALALSGAPVVVP